MSEKKSEMKLEKKFEMIFCIVNAGFSETVMDAAREAGARGGTIIRARGTANQDAEKLFDIAVHSDKEIAMILVPVEIKDAVLTAVYQAASTLETRSIAFSLPVNKTLGLE